MQLVRTNPLADLERMEKDIDKLWQNGWGMLPSSFSSFVDQTTMDLYEEDGKLVAEVALPNFSKQEISVNVNGDVLEVSAKHQQKEEEKNKRRYYFRESNSSYLRRVTLPEEANSDKIDAKFDNGVLKVSMPLSSTPKIKAKNVEVK